LTGSNLKRSPHSLDVKRQNAQVEVRARRQSSQRTKTHTLDF